MKYEKTQNMILDLPESNLRCQVRFLMNQRRIQSTMSHSADR